MGPVIVYRSVNREGATFALKPSSQALLRKHFGDDSLHLRSRIFIAHETKDDFDAIRGDLPAQIVQLLTGLSMERLADLGGVEFRDPETDALIPPRPAA